MGAVNMAMALQRQMDIELELHSESKADKNGPAAKVTVQSLSSQPVDNEEAVERLKNLSLGDNTGMLQDFCGFIFKINGKNEKFGRSFIVWKKQITFLQSFFLLSGIFFFPSQILRPRILYLEKISH